MATFVIPGMKKYNIIVKGTLDDARTAAGSRMHGPLKNVGYSRSAVHATVYTDREVLDEWFRWTTAQGYPIVPGGLLFFNGRRSEAAS